MEQGILAEFEAPEPMVRALSELRRLGYRQLDAFSPYPVREAELAIQAKRSPLTWLVLPFALIGAGGTYFLQWYLNAWDYPLNVGGRPPHSAPAFIPITFEMGVLGASLGGALLFLILSRLPLLYQPLFDAIGIESASNDGFWVAVDARDPLFDGPRLRDELLVLGARRVAYAGTRV